MRQQSRNELDGEVLQHVTLGSVPEKHIACRKSYPVLFQGPESLGVHIVRAPMQAIPVGHACMPASQVDRG